MKFLLNARGTLSWPRFTVESVDEMVFPVTFSFALDVKEIFDDISTGKAGRDGDVFEANDVISENSYS